MFEKSRRKIVVAIMSVLAFLFLGTLTVIYSASYLEVSRSNYEMLARHAQMYSLNEMVRKDSFETVPPAVLGPEPKENIQPEPSMKLRLSTFYSVAVSKSGEVLAVDTADNGLFTESQLEMYAMDVITEAKSRGVLHDLIYLIVDKPGYTLVAFMDNRMLQESMNTLFRYTLIFGSIVILALFFVAIYLAKRIVQPLEESYRKQKQFISDAGHELKTPIAIVNTNAEMLWREIGENPWLSNIQYENERMRLLVLQLLELAKTESVRPQMERLDISRLILGELLPFESVAYEKGLSVQADIQPNLVLMGNSVQLRQLTAILVDNAIRHSENGEFVRVILKEKRNKIWLSVANAGKPICEEQMEHLFDRFYRLDEARNGEDKHYGLGLAIAKAIVVSHKGKIEVNCRDGMVEFCICLDKA